MPLHCNDMENDSGAKSREGTSVPAFENEPLKRKCPHYPQQNKPNQASKATLWTKANLLSAKTLIILSVGL